MRFIIFYSIREIRKKPLRFWTTVLLIGAVLFCMTDLILLLEGTSAARALAGAGDLTESDQKPFHSASFILLLAAHTLLLITSIAILTADSLRRDAEEYAILHSLGVTKLRMMLLRTVEHISAFLAALPIGIPAALLFMRAFSVHINRKLQQEVLVFQIPLPILWLTAVTLFTAVLIGSLLPYLTEKRVEKFSPVGHWNPHRAPMRMFGALSHRRCRSGLISDLAILFIIQILPMIFLIAAFSFRPLAEPPHDCAVLVNEVNRQPIPQTILEQIGQIEGISSLETFENTVLTDHYSAIRIKFDKDAREAGIAAAAEIIDASPHDFLDKFHSTQRASLKNQAHRQLLFWIAGVLFLVAFLLISLILLSSLQGYGETLDILCTLGIVLQELDRFFWRESLLRLLLSGMPALWVAAVCFAVMELEGGGSMPIKEILIAATVSPILQLLWGTFCAYRAQRQFIENRLDPIRAQGRE